MLFTDFHGDRQVQRLTKYFVMNTSIGKEFGEEIGVSSRGRPKNLVSRPHCDAGMCVNLPPAEFQMN